MNSWCGVGNLTRDVELRYAASGTAVGSFNLAVSGVGDPLFIEVVVFGDQADSCNKYLHKGSKCAVEGRIALDTWEDKDTGKKRQKHKIVAYRVEFLGGKSNGGEDDPETPF